ncbi:MAG TPA: HNH endonuclease, partial [Gemmatimonadales bacterium]|nr:HNH endonuclease [Gemmatimonadales bacterium]
SCEVCGFDFLHRYGSIGDGFAEVHHKVPLGRALGERKTKLNDLAVVCSNCHRMLHRGNPLFSMAELQASLNVHGPEFP